MIVHAGGFAGAQYFYPPSPQQITISHYQVKSSQVIIHLNNNPFRFFIFSFILV